MGGGGGPAPRVPSRSASPLCAPLDLRASRRRTERPEVHPAHGALARALWNPLGAARTALAFVLDGRLASEQSHVSLLENLAESRCLHWGQPPSMHRRPHSRVNRTSPSSAPASASAVASRFRQRLGRPARRPDRPRQGHVARIVRPLAVTRRPARSTAAIVGPKVAGRSSPRRGRRLADRHAVGARARPTHPRTLGRHGGAPTGESAASVRVLGAGLPRFPRPAEHARRQCRAVRRAA